MSEMRIKIPEDVLTVVLQSGPNNGSDYDRERDLEIALRQLSEHPIVPTDEQLAEIRSSVRMEISRDSHGFVDESKDMLWPWFKSLIAEWQRRMFLAPEPDEQPVVNRTIDGFMGITLTRREADKIIDAVITTVAPDSFLGYGQSKPIYRWMEPEVPEEIRDLLLVDGVTFETAFGVKYPGSIAERNEAVVEAYRRGQRNPK